jgi:hypothetical protein
MRALIFVFAALTLACSSEASNPQPPNNTIKIDSGATDSEPVDTGLAETAVDTGVPDANCFGDGGCYNCKPATNDQFLNRCNGAGCSKFDDKMRIPASVWDGGALPAVP